MTRREKIESAAKTFFNELVPGVRWDYTDHKAKPLVLGAFTLYSDAWNDSVSRFDIRAWEWPLTTLREGKPFNGDEPWTILLHRAVTIASI